MKSIPEVFRNEVVNRLSAVAERFDLVNPKPVPVRRPGIGGAGSRQRRSDGTSLHAIARFPLFLPRSDETISMRQTQKIPSPDQPRPVHQR